MIVLVSDGVTSSGEGWIADEIKRGAPGSAKELAVKICYEAKQRCREIHPDDVTVMVAKLQKSA